MNARILLIAAGLAASLAQSALAGPLNPPAGPVAPTMKTLVEVEPRTAINAANTPGNATAMFVISQPGSYYLTDNVVAGAGKSGILVVASQATIDLNGFTISAGVDGVVIPVDSTFTIKNGIITATTGSGIRCASDTARGTIEGVVSQWCGLNGFSMGSNATLRRCTARNNDQVGFFVGTQSVLENCIAVINTSHGFQLSSFSEARDCTANMNYGDGFHTDTPCTFSACHAASNLNGFLTTEAKLDNCDANSNSQKGFDIGNASTVTHCSARHNGLQGLRAGDRNTILSSRFRDQAGANYSYAGLWLQGSFNRVDDCDSSINGYGFYVDPGSIQNVIVRSRSTGNAVANFTIPANNQAAPVVTNPGSSAYTTMTLWSNMVF